MFPYSPYTREAYLLSADVAFKKKRYELAISEYREFINNQVNHPKIEYATFKILKSYSLLMSTKDKNEDPAKAILQIYDSLTAVYKSSEYMKETEKIYLKAKRYILKRAIYVANYYKEKDEYGDMSAKIYVQGECETFKFKWLKVAYHKKFMGRDIVKPGKPSELVSGWQFPSIGSTSYTVLDHVCKNKGLLL